MKIALLTEKYTPDIGGLAISSERLAQLLASAGHNVRVFSPTLNLPPSETRTLRSRGVSVTRFGAHKRADDTLADWFDLITEEHTRNPFDVLHAYFLTQAGFIATLAGRYLDIPSVVSIRGNDVDRAAFDSARFSHSMFALQNANALTSNAQASIRKAKAFFNREIIFIPNGVDTERFKPMERNLALAKSIGIQGNVVLSEATLAPGASAHKAPLDTERDTSVAEFTVSSSEALPQSDARPVIGFAGELREKKGIRSLLSAYAKVNKQLAITLLIVGSIRPGEDKQAFDEFVALNPKLQIHLTGNIAPSDMPAYYSLMDLFVHPSVRDGMPNAILEAMACEKAVIGTLVGGILDILEDGLTGALVPANNADLLAEKILELLNDPDLRARLGKKARATVIEKFSPQKELEANIAVYKKIGLNL